MKTKNFYENIKYQKFGDGLTLIFKELRNLPLVTVNIWVKTGSVNETRKNNGISHFLEHILFKDTQNFPNNSLSREIEKLGGYMNAATSLDFTHYYITLHKNQVEKAFFVLRDMLKNLTIEKSNFEKERGVILEEINRGNDNPENVLWENLYKNFFKDYKYSYPIIGTKKNIKNLDVKDLNDYYKKFYDSNNFIVCVSGDLDFEDVQNLTKKYFVKAKPKKASIKQKSSKFFNVELKKNLSFEKKMKTVSQTYFAYAFNAPNFHDENFLEINVLSRMLSDGLSSRFYKVFREEKELVWHINTAVAEQKLGTLFVIFGTCEFANLKKIEQTLKQELQNIEKNLSNEDLEKVKICYKLERELAFETTSQITDILGYYEFFGDYKKYFDFDDKLEKLDLQKILKATKNIFKQNYLRQIVTGKI